MTFAGRSGSRAGFTIALLTARDMEIDIVSGLECGADDYITKPFSLMVLRARIRALLRRNVPEQKSEYRKGCFHFLFDRMEFYKEGRPVELSKTERRILQLLVFHEGQVITRDRLMEWVWPDEQSMWRTMRSPSASVVSGISWKMPRPGRNISGLFMEKDMCGSQTDTTGGKR